MSAAFNCVDAGSAWAGAGNTTTAVTAATASAARRRINTDISTSLSSVNSRRVVRPDAPEGSHVHLTEGAEDGAAGRAAGRRGPAPADSTPRGGRPGRPTTRATAMADAAPAGAPLLASPA